MDDALEFIENVTEEDTINTDRGKLIVKRPARYSEIPKISAIDGHKITDSDEYFGELLHGNIDVNYVNGVYTDDGYIRDEMILLGEFGSLMDWVPLINDDEYNRVYYNCNPDSKMHERICLSSSDNHGREGFSIVDKDVSLEHILKKICEYQDMNDWKELKGWDKFYEYPIKRVMDEYNMDIHFG